MDYASLLATPEMATTMYHAIRERIRAQGIYGHDRAVDRLALALVGVLKGGDRVPQRVTLVGPPGTGKTALALSLGAAMPAIPSALASVEQISPVGWAGATFDADILPSLLAQAGGDPERARRCVLVLDEVDKLGRADLGGGASRDHALEKARAWLNVLGVGAPFRYGPTERDRSLLWDSAQSLVVCCGVFPHAPPDRDPTADDLVRYGGLPRELAERLGAGCIIRLHPLGADDLARVLRAKLAPVAATYADYGFALEVSDEVLAYVTTATSSGRAGLGPRSAAGLLAAAAYGRLAALLAARAPAGTQAILTPDDLALGPSSRRWSR